MYCLDVLIQIGICLRTSRQYQSHEIIARRRWRGTGAGLAASDRSSRLVPLPPARTGTPPLINWLARFRKPSRIR